ncbi:MAG: M28 family peptidase [bacterium]|nr:M28 family peptidase [bacterium]
MSRSLLPLLLISFAIWLAAVGVAAEVPISEQEIAAHIRFLSHDLLEGRGIATRGEALAVTYLETMFRLFGLEPVFGDSYQQEIVLRRVTSDPAASMELVSPDGASMSISCGDDFVAVKSLPAQPLPSDVELVYVGYGIVSERWQWDDYKDADLRGKVIVAHVNEPGPDRPELFEGRSLTYFGRWTYKYQEAARHGAVGALLIHTTEEAGYDWTVVRNSGSGDFFYDPDAPDLLPLQAWITSDVAARLFQQAGHDLEGLRSAAGQRSFRPIPLGIKLRLNAEYAYQNVVTRNVAGVVRGRGGDGRAVVLTAHHDHLGRGREMDGDDIYNGALDNGSAMATLLALARVVGAQAEPFASDVVFFAPAAEEEGLVGSDYFVRNSPVPTERIAANLNFELTNVWGRTHDLIAIGGRHSDLGDVIARVAARHGMSVSPESAPEQGYFFRSDQINFARAGIPAVWIDCGEKLVGEPEGTGTRLRQQYRATAYHRPSDELDPAWELAGTVQLTELALEILRELDGLEKPLSWKPDSSFQR